MAEVCDTQWFVFAMVMATLQICHAMTIICGDFQQCGLTTAAGNNMGAGQWYQEADPAPPVLTVNLQL